MQIAFSLTVSEAKRFIAKGIAQHPAVLRALQDGTVAVTSGTTNGYVIEEITGEPVDKTQYVTGNTMPAAYAGPRPKYKLPDFVLCKGERLDLPIKEAVQEMGPGDVLMKGVNAINYDLGQAGVLIGHPTGGTVGATLGTVVAKRIRLIHPVGLEKSVPGDLNDAAALMKDVDGKGPALWVTPGDIFTEIEALSVLADIDAIPIAAGGIGGAEGAIWLAVIGAAKEIDAVNELIDAVRGEPPFIG